MSVAHMQPQSVPRPNLTTNGWNLTFNPDFAIGEELLLPDGNGLLERVDDILTGFKSGRHRLFAYACCASYIGMALIGTYMTLTRF